MFRPDGPSSIWQCGRLNAQFWVKFESTVSYSYTGRFMMFSVITNIYNKETKVPTLMELFTATGKLKKFFFFTILYFLCVHHLLHCTHLYDIKVLVTHWGFERVYKSFGIFVYPSFYPHCNIFWHWSSVKNGQIYTYAPSCDFVLCYCKQQFW
jgi:hypothetical protein